MTFDYLSWEAFATLLTGALAVGAAILVGLRQVGIAQRQADIQEKQVFISHELTKIEKRKVMADLYDRRLATFAAVDDWLRWVVQHGEAPALNGDIGADVRARFESAMITSRFLFRPIVHETIQDCWKMGNDLHYANASLKAGDSRTAEHAENRTKIMGRLARWLTVFPEIVGSEMDLGQALEDSQFGD